MIGPWIDQPDALARQIEHEASQKRERAEREHDAAVNKFLGAADGLTSSGFGRKAPETAPSAASELPVTESDLDEVIAYAEALHDALVFRQAMRRMLDAKLTPPVVLPDWMCTTLKNRKGLNRVRY